MKKIFLILISLFILILTISIISASDVLVWQGQYYTGTTFNTGTYTFNFTVYDALTGGDICYSNTTALTTGNFGEWKTEQSGVNSACNNISKDYYLNININGADQTPRKRLVVWRSLRKDVDEVSTGDLVLHGILQGLSPLKLQDEINFLKSDGTITSALYNAPRAASSSLPSTFADSLIHDIIQETNNYGMQECFWDENTKTMQMCISGAYLPRRATTISRSLQIVGNTTSKQVNENFTLCEGNNYVDCETDETGADLLVQDDIEAIGSVFSQENITADDTGFFGYLGSLISRITELFVTDIDVSGDVNVTGTITLNGTSIDDWEDVNVSSGSSVSDTVWDITSSNYLYNNSGILDVNETRLNTSIDLRTPLNTTNSSYLYVNNKLIHLNETRLNTSIDARAITPNLTNYALKNQSETFAGNITTTQTGFFGYLGSLILRITKLWVRDIDANNSLKVPEQDTSSVTCNANREREIVYNPSDDHFYACRSKGGGQYEWKKLT